MCKIQAHVYVGACTKETLHPLYYNWTDNFKHNSRNTVFTSGPHLDPAKQWPFVNKLSEPSHIKLSCESTECHEHVARASVALWSILCDHRQQDFAVSCMNAACSVLTMNTAANAPPCSTRKAGT